MICFVNQAGTRMQSLRDMRFLGMVLGHCESSGSFCSVTGAASQLAMDTYKSTDSSVSFDYCVPERLCWPSAKT